MADLVIISYRPEVRSKGIVLMDRSCELSIGLASFEKKSLAIACWHWFCAHVYIDIVERLTREEVQRFLGRKKKRGMITSEYRKKS